MTSVPATPRGDCSAAVDAIRNQALDLSCGVVSDLLSVCDMHTADAPASSEHVRDLAATIARTVLDWIDRWPS
ncbi:hypothetical protein [Mycobacteroides abscessus]|uniref:hypothetical protein n=1 Tax=Mycobacteroides abscessus TaxID=36809 RepID=UPI000C260225|nr:hypothetical protein [Mycobacteroides abscessus]RIS81317.1 hypothetical protein D2E44_14770 [Mycobacteroides abscessus]